MQIVTVTVRKRCVCLRHEGARFLFQPNLCLCETLVHLHALHRILCAVGACSLSERGSFTSFDGFQWLGAFEISYCHVWKMRLGTWKFATQHGSRWRASPSWGSRISATKLTSRLRILGTVRFASGGKRLCLVALLSHRTWQSLDSVRIDSERVIEIHGAVKWLQCFKPCCANVWEHPRISSSSRTAFWAARRPASWTAAKLAWEAWVPTRLWEPPLCMRGAWLWTHCSSLSVEISSEPTVATASEAL